MDVMKSSGLSVAPYPVDWRVEIVGDVKHCGFEYVGRDQTLLDTLERYTEIT